MKVDPQCVKLARIGVLAITGIVVGVAVMAGLGSAMFVMAIRIFASVRGRFSEEIPVDFRQGVLIVSAVVLPALFLIRFYFRSIMSCPSRGVLLAGWIASAVYHTGVTLFLIVRMPAASIGPDGQMIPIALLTGVALVLSILLATQSYQRRSGNSKPLPNEESTLTT